MKNNTIWEFYLMVPNSWTNDWLSENYPAYNIHLHAFQDELQVPSLDISDSTSLVLYAIAINKKERDAFKEERDMSKFVCKKVEFPDSKFYVEYTNDYATYLFDSGNNFITRRDNDKEKYLTKYVSPPRSLIYGERAIIASISEFDFNYNTNTYDVFQIIFGDLFTMEFSDSINFGDQNYPMFMLLNYVKRKFEIPLSRLTVISYLGIFADMIMGDDGYVEEIEDLKLSVNVDEMLLFCKFFGNTMKE